MVVASTSRSPTGPPSRHPPRGRLGCGAEELLLPEPEKVTTPAPAAEEPTAATSDAGAGRAVTPRPPPAGPSRRTAATSRRGRWRCRGEGRGLVKRHSLEAHHPTARVDQLEARLAEVALVGMGAVLQDPAADGVGAARLEPRGQRVKHRHGPAA